MNMKLFLIAVSLVLTNSVFAGGQASYMDTAFNFFPNSKYDTTYTRSYKAAYGSVAIPSAGQRCMVNAHSLKSNTTYTVHVDTNGAAQGNVTTAGPWQLIGQFNSDNNGHGRFNCQSIYSNAAIGSVFSVYINEKNKGTILISSNLVL